MNSNVQKAFKSKRWYRELKEKNCIARSEFMDSQKDFMSRGLSLNSQMTKRLSLRVVSNNQIIMINWFSV
ncbi:hypothetical protein RCL_jg26353.t1 [Rhizophagus clarus]|uniref:Uncharacterized protein n=1 Tax=Rhizophagus clarus TaxID=94130 RepID=A0A8H3KY48_9GLOM|nr:hypothetical protein RCL_jg26353.t1 [Rhizophagus clarus]